MKTSLARSITTLFLVLGAFSASAFAACSVTTSSLPNGTIGSAYAAPTLVASGGVGPYSWSIVNATLPTGLTLSSPGSISGIPSVGGAFTFTVRATDTNTPPPNNTCDKVLTITVPPAITTSSLNNGVLNTPYSQGLTASSTIAPPLTWSISSGSLPTGLVISAAGGTITGTPTAGGTFNFTAAVTDSSSPPLVGTKPLSIVIQTTGLVITTASPLPAGVVGAFYVQQLDATGATSVTWSLANRVLPPGLSLGTNGTISGTPSLAGTFDFTVQAQSTNPSQTVTKDFRIVVNPTLVITTPAVLPTAVAGTAYTVSLSATGGVPPYTWTIPGTGLPNGLTLSAQGVLSGTPITPGNFSFQVTVSDSFNPTQTTSRTFSLTVSSTLTILTSSLPGGAVGKNYSQTLIASAGLPPYTWAVSSGSLPPGISLSTDGTLSGSPSSSGTFNFTVMATDSAASPQTASKALSIVIQPQLTITSSTNLPLAVVGAFYSVLLQATGPSPLTWTVISGIAPPGLSLTTSGSLAGTPAVSGTFDFTVQAAGGDPAQTATQAFHIVVNDALRINTPATLPDASLGAPYSVTLNVSGGLAPYTWTNTGRALPAGLSLSSSGVISGTPTGIGEFSFTAQVSDSFTPVQQVSRTFSIVISSSVSITTITLPPATLNVPYSQTLQATGTAPLTWVVANGTLPAGLTLTTAGVLQGTPTEIASNPVTIRVTDTRGNTATRDFTVVVNPTIPALSITGLPPTLSTRQTFDVSLALASPHPSALTGTLKLVFTPNAENPSDDPATQFSTGSRTATFSIAAGSTTAVFPSKLTLLTGTVAGNIKLTATFDNGPADVSAGSVDIPGSAPQFTDVSAVRTASGLNVQVTGFSPSRRVVTVEFGFDVKNGNSTDHKTLSRNVESEFNDWFRNTASTTYGSAFSFLQSFTITGDTNAIVGVSVRLTNAQGTTASATVAPK